MYLLILVFKLLRRIYLILFCVKSIMFAKLRSFVQVIYSIDEAYCGQFRPVLQKGVRKGKLGPFDPTSYDGSSVITSCKMSNNF